MRAEIMAVGEELLLGKVLDENSRWLAEQLSELGFELRRFTCVGDQIAEIQAALREAVARGPRVIVTTGGLGPTPDDLTIAAAAGVAGRPMRLDPDALRAMLDRAGVQRPELLPLFEKVATLPEGAATLYNPAGWAPGVALEHGGASIFLLPGPPREVKAIFDTAIRPRLAGLSDRKRASRRAATPMREANLSPLMQRVMAEVPDSYLKAYVAQRTPDGWLPLDIVAFGATESEAAACLDRAVGLLTRLVEEAGRPFRLDG